MNNNIINHWTFLFELHFGLDIIVICQNSKFKESLLILHPFIRGKYQYRYALDYILKNKLLI